jgi:hypothetical protein
MEFLATFITFAGFVVGLGAVTVIDTLGFLGRKSPYWTETTIRAHKITKPLIWIGISLLAIGVFISGVIDMTTTVVFATRLVIIAIMIANGSFLSFVISPELLKREKENRITELLPTDMQRKIILSFIVSFVSWWGMLAWVVCDLISI